MNLFSRKSSICWNFLKNRRCRYRKWFDKKLSMFWFLRKWISNFITIANINRLISSSTIEHRFVFTKITIFFRSQCWVTNLINNTLFFFRVTKKIDKLIYRLNIFKKWIIHSIFFIVQLKSCFDSIKNFFRRHRFIQSNFVFVEKNIDLIKFFELKRIINKRMIVRREIEYLVKWKDYDSEYDVWRNLSKLNDVMNLMQKYENSIRYIVDLSDRHRLSKSVMLKKFFANQNNKFINRKSFANQNKTTFVNNKFIFVDNKFITSQSTFVFRFLIVVSRKFFSISSTSASLTFSFEALILRRFNRLTKNWKVLKKSCC